MESFCIDLVDSKTEDENHQSEETKQGILFDGTIAHNLPKAMKSENENGHFDVEGDLIKTELKVEIGKDSDSTTVTSKRVNAEHEVLNVDKIKIVSYGVDQPVGQVGQWAMALLKGLGPHMTTLCGLF